MLTLFVNYLEEHEDEILDELKTYFKEEGMKKGMEKGEKKASCEIARNLKGILSDEEISRVTEVPLEKVAQL